jgi:hypothetical protein
MATGQGDPSAQPSQVKVQCMDFEKGLEWLNLTISSLEKRLGSVLRPPAPSAEGQEGKSTEALVPLAQDLQAANSHLRAAVERLESIQNRLEIS